MTAILVVLTIIVAVAIDAGVMAWRRRHAAAPAPMPLQPMPVPCPPHGVFVDNAHSWVRITTDGALRVGIDEFLADALGEVTAVQAPSRGTHVRRGDPLLTLRIGDRLLVVPAPADGEVSAINGSVIDKPWTLTRDPYGVGWVVALWTRDHQEAIRPLRIGAGVAAFLRDEMQRLADFLTRPSTPQTAAVLADGGVPCRGALAALGDDALQSFQQEFLGGAAEER